MSPKWGNKHEPEYITCENLGFIGSGLKWECRAYLDKKYEFVEADVSCEGWSGPGDEFIVPGSCMVNYLIKKTK